MTITSARGRVMLNYLPSQFYLASTVLAAILEAQGEQLDALQTATDQLLLAAYLDTAPDWSLPLWEEEYGLGVSPTLSSADRKARIAPLILGGIMPNQPSLTAFLARIVPGSGSRIIEDFAGYTVTIGFLDIHSIPDNFQAVRDAVRAYLPAHLDLILSYGVLTWDALDALGYTWDALDALALNWNQFEVI